MKYNKLVRDKIPEIIEENGGEAITYIANNEEYWQKLKEKLQEETQEVLEDEDILGELADLMEVVYAICDYKGISYDELENKRQDKKQKRGGFQEGIILDES